MKKENVYLIRGKNGEYALGTKICASSRGAKNSMNSYVDGVIDHTIRTTFPRTNDPMSDMSMIRRWQGGPELLRDWLTLDQHLQTTHLNYCRITERDYDAFVKLVDGIIDYWSVEEVEQNA